jgi:KDO2-lipid IV(A) lauroyltransferase
MAANGGRRLARRLRRMGDAVFGFFAVGALKTLRLFPPDAMSNFAGAVMRNVGPWLPEHRVGRANLAAAYPQMPPDEIERILRGVWDNLGRLAGEFAHIDRLWDVRDFGHPKSRISASEDTVRIATRLRDDGKPALIFAAHLANWEMAAVCATSYGVGTTVLYRRPNSRAVSDAVIALRAGCMGTLVPTSIEAPLRLVDALERGSHVALLVDQYNVNGVDVTFFGRRTKTSPLIAWLAGRCDCPIHGIRVIRQPGNRFELQVTEAITPARDANGQIDARRTMQIISDVVEEWVREHPEQWLWVHRRWREEPPTARS